VERVKKLLLSKGVDAGEIKTLEKRAKKEVDAAVEESKVRLEAAKPPALAAGPA
jgi:TPP-dependent pyruvate/acetoin dehydrogenase alpha subunit